MIDGLDLVIITGLGFGIIMLIFAIILVSFDKDVNNEDLKEDK